MLDDKTGKPKTPEEVGATVLDLFAAREEEHRAKHEAVTTRFVAMVVASMAKGPPEEIAREEHGFVELFEMLLPGEGGGWVRDIYRRARAIRGQTQ